MAGGDEDDLIQPPPGGYLRDPRPDSSPVAEHDATERAERAALERIASALEALENEVGEIRRLLSERMPPPDM
jgi:hypothetical protein